MGWMGIFFSSLITKYLLFNNNEPFNLHFNVQLGCKLEQNTTKKFNKELRRTEEQEIVCTYRTGGRQQK
jgi:hypothetical protein